MKFNLNKNDLEKLNNLFKIDEENRIKSEFLLDYFKDAKIIASLKKDEGIEEIIESYYQLDDLFDLTFNKDDINKYLNNPYNKNIKLADIKERKYEYQTLSYDKFEGFLSNDVTFDDNYNEIYHISYFENKYYYSSLIDSGNIWMLITPHEINTMEKAINKASGKVLVLGLGLGYYAYMISLKKEVKEIVIIENDKKIIDMFNKYIYNQIENKNKIKIINDNAYNYLQNNDYDYTFIDIYRDVDDGMIHYLNMSKSLINNNHDFWIESSFIITIRRLLIDLIYEQLNNESVDYENSNSIYDKIINNTYKLTKDLTFKSFKEISDFLSENNIKKLIQLI